MKLSSFIKASLVVGLAGGLIGCGTYSHNVAPHKHNNGLGLDCGASNEVRAYNQPEAKQAARVVSDTYHFTFNNANLTPEGKAHVKKYADFLANNQDIKVRVEGHADQRGKAAYNVKLAKNRAQAVSKYLQERGVSRSNIEIVSFGAENPVDAGTTEEAYAKNRRAELYFDTNGQEIG